MRNKKNLIGKEIVLPVALKVNKGASTQRKRSVFLLKKMRKLPTLWKKKTGRINMKINNSTKIYKLPL